MPIFRGKDGVPVEIDSHMPPKKEESLGGSGDDPTIPPDRKSGGSLFDGGGKSDGKGDSSSSSLFPSDDPKTTPWGGGSAGGSGGGKPPLEDPVTVIAGGASKRSAPASGSSDVPADPMADPVAGWLVVVGGPGKGHIQTLGYGQNSIGRSPNERVSLNYGDMQISRNSHAVVTFDPRGKNFYCQQGSGTNLAYLNEAPVLTPTVISSGDQIMLGDTVLRFVALCGAEFDWQELDKES